MVTKVISELKSPFLDLRSFEKLATGHLIPPPPLTLEVIKYPSAAPRILKCKGINHCVPTLRRCRACPQFLRRDEHLSSRVHGPATWGAVEAPQMQTAATDGWTEHPIILFPQRLWLGKNMCTYQCSCSVYKKNFFSLQMFVFQLIMHESSSYTELYTQTSSKCLQVLYILLPQANRFNSSPILVPGKNSSTCTWYIRCYG